MVENLHSEIAAVDAELRRSLDENDGVNSFTATGDDNRLAEKNGTAMPASAPENVRHENKTETKVSSNTVGDHTNTRL